jgi:fumarate reductase subunit D|nr:hypothetical protein [uncultured Oscillibacter sp.]
MAVMETVILGVFTGGLLLLVGGVLLQIFLSKRESRWPGLVLPLLTFLCSLLGPLNVADTGSVSQNVLLVAVTLLAGNIPTLVLLAIYWAAREKHRVRDQMEKMGKQDISEL